MVGESVRFLLTSCEESQTNEWAWIKIVQANQPWSYLFILWVLRFLSNSNDNTERLDDETSFIHSKASKNSTFPFKISRPWNEFCSLKSKSFNIFFSKFQQNEKRKLFKAMFFKTMQAYSSSLSSKGLSLFHHGNASVVAELDCPPSAVFFTRVLAVCCFALTLHHPSTFVYALYSLWVQNAWCYLTRVCLKALQDFVYRGGLFRRAYSIHH